MFRKLTILLTFAVAIGCSNTREIQEIQEPITIEIGMKKTEVIEILSDFGATDIGEGMQTTALMKGESNPKGWMWSIESPNLSIETKYQEGKLTELNVWDWTKRKLTSYHHTMEYDEVSQLKLIAATGKFQTTVIKTHNQRAK